MEKKRILMHRAAANISDGHRNCQAYEVLLIIYIFNICDIRQTKLMYRTKGQTEDT